jgi:hypothetical protein
MMRERELLLSSLERDMLSRRYADRPYLFSELVEQPLTMSMSDWDRRLAVLVKAGRLTRVAVVRLRGCDLVIRGGEPESPTYLVFRVAKILTEHDVYEALNFAELLAGADLNVRPAVAGHQITREGLALVNRLSVARMLEAELDGDDPINDEDVVPSTLFRAPRAQQ